MSILGACVIAAAVDRSSVEQKTGSNYWTEHLGKGYVIPCHQTSACAKSKTQALSLIVLQLLDLASRMGYWMELAI